MASIQFYKQRFWQWLAIYPYGQCFYISPTTPCTLKTRVCAPLVSFLQSRSTQKTIQLGRGSEKRGKNRSKTVIDTICHRTAWRDDFEMKPVFADKQRYTIINDDTLHATVLVLKSWQLTIFSHNHNKYVKKLLNKY